MKALLLFLLSLPLVVPFAMADDTVSQAPVATPADKHTELKNAASSDAKDIPPAVLEAKKKFAVEKRTLDQHIKDVIAQFGPTSPQAIQAKEEAHARLAELRTEIAAARKRP
jgi:hypothetical protein